jgi:hypothetical protein
MLKRSSNKKFHSNCDQWDNHHGCHCNKKHEWNKHHDCQCNKKHEWNKHHDCQCNKKHDCKSEWMDKHVDCHCCKKNDSCWKPKTLFTKCEKKHHHCEKECHCECHCECIECVEIFCVIQDKHCPWCGR